MRLCPACDRMLMRRIEEHDDAETLQFWRCADMATCSYGLKIPVNDPRDWPAVCKDAKKDLKELYDKGFVKGSVGERIAKWETVQ